MHAEIHLIIRAIYVGLFTGFILALPTGPAGLESIRWTLNHGLRKGMIVVCGCLTSDLVDMVLINYGFLELMRTHIALEVGFWLLAGLGIFVVGFREIRHSRKHEQSDLLEPHPVTDKKHRPYLTGFLMNISNPGSHFFWLTLSSTVIAFWHKTGKPSYYAFSASLLFGMFLGLTALNLLAHQGKRLSPPKVSGKIGRLIPYGISLMGLGFIATGVIRLIRHVTGA